MKTLNNYIGEKYNMLTILDLDYKFKSEAGRWYYRMKCICDCGKESVVDLKELKRGNTKSCGCLAKSLEKPIIPGEIYNNFKVLSEALPSIDPKTGEKNKNVHIECTECGHKRTMGWYYLKSRKSNKCTCPKQKLPKKKKEPKNFIGYTSGKYIVVEQYEWDKSSQSRKVKVRCECGFERTTNMRSLRKYKPKGCAKCTSSLNGLSSHPLYSKWRGIIARCEYKNINMYYRYGGRGISMCREWRDDFMKFYNWSLENGWKEGLEIDRKNTDGDYTPDNCRYVTRTFNNRNSTQCKLDWDKVDYIREHKDKYTSRELADKFGVGTDTIRSVIRGKSWVK